MKSRETTIAGIFTGIALIAGQIANLLDKDPATTLEYTVIAAAIGMIIVGWRSRDINKSSESVGAN